VGVCGYERGGCEMSEIALRKWMGGVGGVVFWFFQVKVE
jgi:hypothetical protein